MDKKEKVIDYLNGYKRAFKRWVECTERIKLLREKQMAAGSPNLTGLPKAGNAIDLSDYVVKLEMQIEDCKQKREKTREEMRKVKDVVMCVFDETDRRILNFRYLDFMSFTEIAELINMSKSTISRRHDEACLRLYRKIYM